MRRRFSTLRIVATLYKIVGVLAGLLSIPAAILAFSIFRDSVEFISGTLLITNGPLLGLITAAGTLITGLLTAISLYAFGQFIELMLAVEENTRASAILNRKIAQELAQRGENFEDLV